MINQQTIIRSIQPQSTINELAIIHPSAKIAEGVTIGPWTKIGPHVEIGEGSVIDSHVIIKQHTRIGRHNKIHSFVSLGEDPQHTGYQGEETWLEIGDHNTIREFSTIHRGTLQGGCITRVGSNNFIMCYVHVAHDCHIGNNTIFVNNASLAGHVTVEDYAMIGVFVGIHQYCTVGAYSFVSQAAMVSKDILPYLLVAGHNPTVSGLNVVGLKRRGFSEETIRSLRRAYNIIFRENITTKQAIIELEEMSVRFPEIQRFIDGLRNSSRGVVR